MNELQSQFVMHGRADVRHAAPAPFRDAVEQHGGKRISRRNEARVGQVKRAMQRSLVDQLGLGELLVVPQLQLRVSAAIGDMAHRAVDVQPSPSPSFHFTTSDEMNIVV